MKKSKLKEYIREIILAELIEVDADKTRGTVVMPRATQPPVIKKMTDQGIDVELREEEESTKDKIKIKKSKLKKYIREMVLAELAVTNESLFGRSEFKPLQTYKPPTTLQRFVTKGKDFLGIENKEHRNKFEKLIKNLINPPYEGFVSNIKKIGGSDEMPSMVADTMMGNLLVICNKKDPKIILNGEELELNDYMMNATI